MAEAPVGAPPSRLARFARTISARAVLAGLAVAAVSVLVTAAIAVPVTVRISERQARQSLAAEATLAQAALRGRADRGRDAVAIRIVAALNQQGIEVYLINGGRPDRAGLPANVVQRVANGKAVRGGQAAKVNGRRSLIEGRPLPNGDGVVLVRPRATGAGLSVWRSLWLPLLAGLAAGVLAGVLLARRLARPIRNAAVAAAALRAGDRGVRVPVEQPTEVADLGRALNELAAALAASEGRQREFLLSVSHELRTPLTTVRGYAEALSDGVIDGESAQRAGRTMLGEAERLDRLVADLLALARLEAADFPLEWAPVDLTALAAAAAEAWQARCVQAGVELRAELPPGRVTAQTDPGRIRQVLDGLMENALRVLPAGAPVVISVRGEPGGAVLELRDGGPGFTDDDLAVVFERGALHQRYKGVRKVGSGLGLALAAGLVRRLGGHIAAGHAPEGGARFTVHLPYAMRTLG